MKKSLLSISISISSAVILLSCTANGAVTPQITWQINDVDGDNIEGQVVVSLSNDGRDMVGNSWPMKAFYLSQNDSGYKWTNLGTLDNDIDGSSWGRVISANGQVIAGLSTTDNGYQQAFVFHQGDHKITGLGTLIADNSGYSDVNAISADGRVIVGESQRKDTISSRAALVTQAFAFYRGDIKMTALGTLKTNNSGYSSALAVSADGQVIVGSASTDGVGGQQAFVFHQGDIKMTGLGTLKTDNTGRSSALAVSADGLVIVGSASTDGIGGQQAFVFHQGDIKMTGLGSLKTDNTGDSSAQVISANGQVIAGTSATDSTIANKHQAFAFYQGDTKMTALGTLVANNLGESEATGISADGRIIVGNADTDHGYQQAFFFYQGDSKMATLGTLAADNTGESFAFTISADGRVVGGAAETDGGYLHAAIWKLAPVNPTTPPVGPTQPPVVTIVDKENSHQAMAETGRRGFKVLDLYQSALTSLGDSRCQMGESDYCVGVFSQLDSVSSNQRIATGVFGSLRFLPSESWIAGGAINFANHTRLINNYDTRGESYPGIALFTRYQQNRDNSGFNAELSGTFLKQGIAITRDKLQNTEAGEGNSRVKGYQAQLSTGYGIRVNENTLITPTAALIYHNVERDGYTETRNAEFAATYGHMGNKRTDLQAGINAQYNLTPMVLLDGALGTRVKLNGQRDAFTGQIDYIGAYAYDAGRERTVTPYAQSGVNVALSANSTLRTNIGWQQTDYRNDALQVGLSYSYHW